MNLLLENWVKAPVLCRTKANYGGCGCKLICGALSLFAPAQWVIWITVLQRPWATGMRTQPGHLLALELMLDLEVPNVLDYTQLFSESILLLLEHQHASLEGVSLLVTQGITLQAYQTMKARLLVTGLHWCCKRGRDSSGLVTTDANRRSPSLLLPRCPGYCKFPVLHLPSSTSAVPWFSVTGLKSPCGDSAFDKTFCS